MLVAFVIAIIACFDSTSESLIPDTPTREIEPSTVATMEDGTVEFYFDLSSYDSGYSSLMFFSNHEIVHAYHRGKEIYAFDKVGGFWSSSPGSEYNFIPINDQMHSVVVTVQKVYSDIDGRKPIFYIGSTYTMYDELLKDSIPRFLASVLIIMVSVALFLYYALMHKKLHLTKELIYLAYFALFIGVWSANETITLVLIFDNKVFESLMPYFCLLLAPSPFIMFFDMYLGINSKILKKVMLFASMFETVLFVFLHFTKIAEFRETLSYIQIMLFIQTMYVVGSVLFQIARRDFSRQTRICAVGVTMFLVALIVDVKNYYQITGDADILGRYLFLVFIIMLAWDLIKGTNEVIEKGRHVKQLEAFALTDSMTGLLNRNAFESHMKTESGKDLTGLIAVVADANGLKKCNDTYGHEAGDEYITTVAKIFNNVYGRYGNCYRTGGDEFCCIIPQNNKINMERLKQMFMTKIYTVNLEGHCQYSLGVAIGYAQYDAQLDEDFKALVKRADASMYENKKAYNCG